MTNNPQFEIQVKNSYYMVENNYTNGNISQSLLIKRNENKRGYKLYDHHLILVFDETIH